jgi:cell division cycle protein 20 (cofactor of APC complex)
MSGHEGRILHLASSPDGQKVATAGADETLRFWKCFESDKKAMRT